MPRIKKHRWVQLTVSNFRIGAMVRVNPKIEEPRYEWGAVRPFDEGVIKTVGQLHSLGKFSCDFFNHPDWIAQIEEMQIFI